LSQFEVASSPAVARRCTFVPATIALLLASTAHPAYADGPFASAAAAVTASQPAPETDPSRDIIVTAPPLFRDLLPERDLDRTAIDSYGVSTVDELLGEIQNEIGDDDDPPLILVNGERVSDVGEIGAFPVEAVRNVQVLPRGSAVRVGGNANQRVISLTLKRTLRSATLTVAPKVATEGDYSAVRGETLFTYLHGSTRANVAFRVRDESALLDSDREIVQPDPRLPFAIGGNVIAFPGLSGEIDPLLSALAGSVVVVAPVPGASTPVLSDFLGPANVTDFGRFRTLRPDSRSYDLNGTFGTRLTPWLTGTGTLRLSRRTDRSLRGLPSALFVLPAVNPSSPFANDVGLAFYGPDPLHSSTRRDSLDADVTLNATFGRWIASLDLGHSIARDLSRSEQVATFASIPIDDDIDPFTSDLGDPIALRSDRATARTRSSEVELRLSGPLAEMPAGPLQATFEGDLHWDRLRSQSTFSVLNDRDIRRSDQSLRASVDIPITSRANSFLGEIGDLSATAEVTAAHSSYAGTLHHDSLGLSWEPRPLLRLRASIDHTDRAPQIEVLGNPVVVTQDARVFDPLTGDTVDVELVSGGNPDLRTESVTVRRVNALLRLVPRLNLQLNAEYTDSNRRNFVSGLPSASAAVMLAFPDRYVRDADGVLTRVDLRPVNFDSHREKRLRWGFSMNTALGAKGTRIRTAMATDADGDSDAPPPPRANAAAGGHATYLQLTLNHSVVFSDKIVIRPDLDSVDLLSGGAIGIGGGRVRHQLDGTASLTSGGLGVRLGATWRGRSTLTTRLNGREDELRFSPLFIVNLRAFADARRLLPHSPWAKGLRVSLNVLNATNDRQAVRDSSGYTPLQFQPAYRDPIGRTVEIEIRKVF
jgi:hypothetical protein